MSYKIFDNNLVAIRKSKLSLKLNKPAYIEMCVLELSKALMYEFHYNYIKNKYDNKSKLLFTDSDSLMYEIKTENVSEDFSSDKELFDLTNCWTKSIYYDDANRSVIGKLKEKTGGVAIKEFVRLKPKTYLLLAENNENKKAKGVTKNVVPTKIIE